MCRRPARYQRRSACSGASDEHDLADQPAPGTPGSTAIAVRRGGQALTFGDGTVRARRPRLDDDAREQEDQVLDLVFTTATADICRNTSNNGVGSGQSHAILRGVPARLGTHSVLNRYGSALFSIEEGCHGQVTSSNAAVSWTEVASATIAVTRLDAERVEGHVSAKFSDLSSIEGTFSFVPCPGSDGFAGELYCF